MAYERMTIEGMPVAQLKELAAAQIQRAKDAFSDAWGQNWAEFILLPLAVAEAERYKPLAKRIGEAEDLYSDGKKQRTDRGKYNAYRSAFRVAEEATQDIVREGKLGPLYEKYPRQAKDWLKQTAGESLDELKRGVKEGARELGKGLGGIAVVVGLFLLLRGSGDGARTSPEPPRDRRRPQEQRRGRLL